MDKVYLKAAQNAVKFVLDNMRELDGRLYHRHREGESAIMANLDDYAFLIWGLIECYEASHDASFLKTALRLQEDLTKHFWDKENGGYYFTPDDGEDLIVREKESYDGAIPSGNSVAMLNMVRLSRLTGKCRTGGTGGGHQPSPCGFRQARACGTHTIYDGPRFYDISRLRNRDRRQDRS